MTNFNFNERSNWFKNLLWYQINILAESMLEGTDDSDLDDYLQDKASYRWYELADVMKNIGHQGVMSISTACCAVCVPFFAKVAVIKEKRVAKHRAKITDARTTDRLTKDIKGLDDVSI